MKVFGIVVLVLGFVVIYIGITGSQHRIMNILKGVHLAPQSAAKPAASKTTNSSSGGSVSTA